jgi:hypothetical protein
MRGGYYWKYQDPKENGENDKTTKTIANLQQLSAKHTIIDSFFGVKEEDILSNNSKASRGRTSHPRTTKLERRIFSRRIPGDWKDHRTGRYINASSHCST